MESTESPARLDDEDLYRRLGLTHDATPESIRRGYRALLRRYPPERFPEEFKRIREAYETLSDPQSREDYDARPDPIIAAPLERGMEALRNDEYEAAENAFKQVLLHAPEMGYVRNLLGLALLYQEKAEKALEQFERVLARPDASATWFGNAGHAYLRLERFVEARQAFESAIARANDNPVGYVTGLADALCAVKRFNEAAQVLDRWIHDDGVVDFQDLDYFVKLLEVHLRAGRAELVRETLLQMRSIASDEEQARLLAFKVGLLACGLVRQGRFDYAHALTALSCELQPEDGDYSALQRIALFLHHEQFDQARHFLDTHPAFAPRGWLNDLGDSVRLYLRHALVFTKLTPIDSAPPLRTINGVGTMLYGSRDRDTETNSHIATLYFTFFFVPIIPLKCYRVIPTGASSWKFVGTVPWSSREWWHVGIVTCLVVYYTLFTAGSEPSRFVYTPPPASFAPASAVPTANTAASYLSPEGTVDTESVRIESRRGVLDSEIARLKGMDDEIESLKRRISAIEDGIAPYSTADPEYQRLLNEHNTLVDDYNSSQARLRIEIESLNNDIAAYNARNN